MRKSRNLGKLGEGGGDKLWAHVHGTSERRESHRIGRGSDHFQRILNIEFSSID